MQWLDFSDLPFIPKRLFIGLSGGLDSCVLFDLLFHNDYIKNHNIELILVNVNHHTDPREEALSALAARLAENYKTKVHLLHVKNACPSGASIEDFMRKERYALFDSLLEEQDILLTAHHVDDQAETVLLNLMRGAGLQGLRGMPRLRKQGKGYLWRPLLAYSKAELAAYAREKSLIWLEDPTNTNLSLDRVFLRQEILPLLSRRWPKAKEVLARTASHVRGAQDILESYLKQDLEKLMSEEGALDLKQLKHYPQAHGVLLLKTYLDHFNYRLSAVQLQQIYQDFVLSDNDAHPLFQYKGITLTRLKNKLLLSRISG